MLIIKIAVFLLFSTQLLAVQKSLKITCAACKTTPAGCTTGKCYQLTGKDLALESCAKAEICDFIKDGVTLTIGNCTVDFQGGPCSTKTCVYPNGEITMATASGCTAASSKVTTICATELKECTDLTPGCTNCMTLTTTPNTANAQPQNKPVCMSTNNATCYKLGQTQINTVTSCAKTGPFGETITGCCTTIVFPSSDPNAGLCSNQLFFGTDSTIQKALAAWVSEERMALTFVLLLIGTMLI